MKSLFHFVIFILALWSSCAQAQISTNRWEPVPPGVILTRNVMVPESPAEEGFQLLPGNYHLGSKAYAKVPPDWWLNMARELGIGDRWHPKDFPLAYAGEFKATNGTLVLLVVQVSHAFTGDGFYSRGPELYLIARLFRFDEAGRKLVKEESFDIGSMQFYRLLAGEANGRDIVFRVEGGGDFDSKRIYSKKYWTLHIGDDNSLGIKQSD